MRTAPKNNSSQLARLMSELAEIREGQHELLRMYEELRELYPKHCRCAVQRERALRELRAFDVLANSTEYEEYRPS